MANAQLTIIADTLQKALETAVPIFGSTCTHPDTLVVAEALSAIRDGAATAALFGIGWCTVTFTTQCPVSVEQPGRFIRGKYNTTVIITYPSFTPLNITVTG